MRLHVHMEFSSACDSIEDYCLVHKRCVGPGEWPFARELGAYRIHTE